ncbi:GH25 family lysozyme [Limosilactobacillus reuteri]|uniref:GH25 family lysozyme n=1 Tax=Limosilactobacillus reuteri TaxID=1598 RepID=UPI001CDCB165|nr:GH25 family lysozyme [Limosilactobacillus reuteri]
MEIKKRYKLYKDGKNWCAMALAVAAVSAGLVLGNTNVKADTPTDNVPVVKTTKPTTDDANTELASQEKAAQAKDNGNYGYLDAAQVVNNNDLHISGWQATNQAAGKDNRYLVAYDSTTNTELGRTSVTENVARPDVAKAYPDVVNAKDSGYQTIMNNLDWNKVKSVDDQIQIVSRYSDAANGEGNRVDNWSQPINLDKGNYAYLDNFGVKDNQLQVTGWNATNQSLDKANHYVILFDRTTGREITRNKIEVAERPDVAKVYPQVINAKASGFSTAFSLAGIDFNHELQVISRYSDAANGEGNRVDYWFAPKKFMSGNTSNQGNLDSFNLSNGQLTVSGWHATDYSQIENNHYLILFDNTNKIQVKTIKVANVTRPDVAKVYPNVQTAGRSGFDVNFGSVVLIPNHSYSIVSRYSTLDGGNGDNRQSKYTDWWSASITLNQQASYIDSFTKTDSGYNVKGWMASDQSINKPNAYLILLNNGQEVARTKVELTDRPDVAKVYPSIYNSQKSGFNGEFKVDPAKVNGTLKVIMRFAGDDANQNYSDQYSHDYLVNDAGNLITVATINNINASPLYTVDVYSGSDDSIISDSHAQGVIVKATQGTYYVNPKCNHQYNLARQEGKLTGLYHYAGGGNPVTEAQYFINSIKNYVGQSILILDWEQGQNPAWGNTNWARKFVDEVHRLTNVWPLIYVQESALNQVANCANDCGLWVAKYPSMNWHSWTVPDMNVNSGAFKQITGWQYTGDDRDRSIFYLNKEEWMKLANPSEV